MAQEFDGFPMYDDVLKSGTNKLSDVWMSFLATFGQTLAGYLGQYGMFVPRITSAQRDTIQSPVNGQLIYNTTTNKFQGYENNLWTNLI